VELRSFARSAVCGPCIASAIAGEYHYFFYAASYNPTARRDDGTVKEQTNRTNLREESASVSI
jgi:hypothetical protein